MEEITRGRSRAGWARGQSHGGVIDSQSVKASAPGAQRGYDAGKKIVGRNRHIAVDTDGRLLMVNLMPADISDSAGARRSRRHPPALALGEASVRRRRLRSPQAHGQAAYLDFVIDITRRSDDQKGFQVLPRRWVVERTFGWMTRWRRLVRDYEQRIDVSHAIILVAMGGNLVQRTAHP
ncbi:transposase [Mesorhizobium sp. M1378]|uniref:transposase n=1 Tax=Mesorhizobium sp. M1378 TaxID=2957092 RepID=UPI00333A533D